MEKKDNAKKAGGIFDFVSIIALAIVAVALSFTFIFRTITVVGSSMYPTLRNGDRIILTAFYTEPEYGDIVVTSQPCEDPIPDVLVKRVIATEGQTVDIDFNQGIVYVDGAALDEPYIAELTRDREDFTGPVVVPEGHIFAMGDNRNASTDSRDDRVGFIREEYILGKALFRMLPFGQFKIG
ncbi:MAG: signal peptidase I [Clostridia bacterium]|nr:signal peptidase I [Clostridia bacterium]